MKFVFDLDGTLCFDRLTIDSAIKDVLSDADRYGHELIFASARSYRDCIDMLGSHLSQNLVIGLNGGLVFDKGQLLLRHLLDKTAYQAALAACQTYNLPFFVDDDFNYACQLAQNMPFIDSVDPLGLAQEVSVNNLTHPIKMVIYMGNHLELADDLVQQLKQLASADISYHENENCLYLNPNQINKATTLVSLIGNNYIAFGNDKNDVALFKESLYSVQVGNYHYLEDYADEKVKADSSAVALKIKELFQKFQSN